MKTEDRLRRAGHLPFLVEEETASVEGVPGTVVRIRCSKCQQTYPGFLLHPFYGLSPRRPCPG